MKTQTYEKKSHLSNGKNFVAFFSPIIEHENIGEQHFLRVHKVFWQFLRKRYHHFFGTLEVDRNKHFKKKQFSSDKNFGPFFPFYRAWWTSGNILQGSKSWSYQYCKACQSIFSRPKRLLKSQTFEKKATFPVKIKISASFFLVTSSATNLMGQIVKVPQVFRQILWK